MRPVQKAAPSRRTDLIVRSIDGEVVILDSAAGKVHQLNPTASCIWNWCDGSASIDSLVARLAEAFDVDFETARKDVAAILQQFQDLGLLDSSGNPT